MLLASLSLPVSAAPVKAASTAAVLPFKATEKTLSNGLKTIVVPSGPPIMHKKGRRIGAPLACQVPAGRSPPVPIDADEFTS
jgi:hypothetical protein